MNTITPAELARRARVSKQAIHKAITSGLIPFTGEGRRKRINPEDPAVVVYITDPSHQRETAAENWPKKQVKPAPPSQIREPKPTESAPPSEKQERKEPSSYIKGMKGGRFFTGKLRTAILERDGHRCTLCGKTPADGIRLEVDHVLEFEDGGETTYENGKTICSECNKGKSAAKKVSKSDEYISITEFGRRVGVHRNGIAEAIKTGRIEVDKITGEINYTTEIINWYKNRGSPPTHSSDPDAAEIKRRTQIAEMRKKELIAAHLERLLLPVDFLEDKVFRYLSKLHSNIERAAGVGIDEIGPKIIEAGEVLPCHIEEFTNTVLKIIHETKLGIIREIKSYEPKTKP